MVTPVILSGGAGSRLWPSSRSTRPKQFLSLVSEKTLFQETVLRLSNIVDVESPVVVTGESHRFLIAEQLRSSGVTAEKIILEPVSRNTAPAIALAAFSMQDPDDVMLVMPADHVIGDSEEFCNIISDAKNKYSHGNVLMFGIAPSSAETGYGYIKMTETHADGFFGVDEFIEKPPIEIANELVKDARYCWNSGIFMFSAQTYLNELKEHQPDIYSYCEQAISGASVDRDFTRVDAQAFSQCPSISIDYAIMESTCNSKVISMEVGWTDIGSWSSLWKHKDKDAKGNVIKGDVVIDDVSNSLIMSDKKLIAVSGLDDIILVETDDSILLTKMDKDQDVKNIVQRLVDEQRPECKSHRKVYRPWGYYDSIESADGYQVKRLVVYPGEQLSLQKHYHRSEHWVVVRGTAEIINGDTELVLTENESTFIPVGAMHRLRNPGKLELEIIEVQSGHYLGEDDIIRYDDLYNRHDEK